MIRIINFNLVKQGYLDLTDYADETTIRRGQNYYISNKVQDVVVNPNGITGTVVNDEGKIYNPTMFQDSDGHLVANCTCPDSRGVWCKHVIAMIYAVHNNSKVVRYLQKVDYEEVKTEYPNITNIAHIKLDGVTLGNVAWALEHLTQVEMRLWLERQKSQKNADPKRHKGQEAYFIEHGEWKLQ